MLVKMGSGISTPITQNLDALHNQLMRHAGADYDIATATTLSYLQFISYITELNNICANYKDEQNCVLVFAVKKGTDTNLFWKATVRIACVKLNTQNNEVETYRLLNIRQFLQVFRRISYECTEGAVGTPPNQSISEGAVATGPQFSMPPTAAASIVLGETPVMGSAHSDTEKTKGQKEPLFPSTLEECIICLERKPEVILPCCHAYCTPCIEQWWEYCQAPQEDICFPRNFLESFDDNSKSCPVCRESLDCAGDTWVISEFPDQSEVSEEIRKSLISYASCSGSQADAGPSSPVKKKNET